MDEKENKKIDEIGKEIEKQVADKDMEKIELPISLAPNEWEVVVEWMIRFPYEEAISIARKIDENAKKLATEEPESGVYTLVLSIHECDKIMFSLGLAPYYLASEAITKIYNQGIKEINEKRKDLQN